MAVPRLDTDSDSDGSGNGMAALLQLAVKLLALYAFTAAASLYAWGVLRRCRVGWPRFLLGLPVIALSLFAPSLFFTGTAVEALLITPIAGVMSLTAFKVLAWSCGRGPLALGSLRKEQFIGVLLIPVIPWEVFTVSGGRRIPDSAGGAPRGTRQLLHDYAKQMACAVAVALLLAARPDMHWFPRHWFYTLCSCMSLGAVFDIFAAGATAVLHIPMAPTFNRPWLSDSFADFWARRWNLTVTYMMRVLVYEPVMEGRLLAADAAPPPKLPPRGGKEGAELAPAAAAEHVHVSPGSADADCTVVKRGGGAAEPAGSVPATPAVPPPPPGSPHKAARRQRDLRRLLALQATFMFSGVWHILVFWYNTHVISWRWAMFFIIQAPIVMAEAAIIRAARRMHIAPLPHTLRVVLTNAALIAVAGPLFFGPADSTGFAARNLATVRPLLDALRGAVAVAWPAS